MNANLYLDDADDLSTIDDIRSTGLDDLVRMMSRGFIITE